MTLSVGSDAALKAALDAEVCRFYDGVSGVDADFLRRMGYRPDYWVSLNLKTFVPVLDRVSGRRVGTRLMTDDLADATSMSYFRALSRRLFGSVSGRYRKRKSVRVVGSVERYREGNDGLHLHFFIERPSWISDDDFRFRMTEVARCNPAVSETSNFINFVDLADAWCDETEPLPFRNYTYKAPVLNLYYGFSEVPDRVLM